MSDQPVADAGTFIIGGDLTVHRLGFGAIRLTGKDIWGEPADRAECLRISALDAAGKTAR